MKGKTSLEKESLTSFDVVKNEVQQSYLSPLLEIHERKAVGREDKLKGFVTIEDLDKSFSDAVEYIKRTCLDGQQKMAQSLLDQLHTSQLDAYDQYFHENVLKKENGQANFARWTQEIQSWNESSLSKDDFEERILTALLRIKVLPSDRENRRGRYTFDGWRLRLSHIFKWIVDPLVEQNYHSGSQSIKSTKTKLDFDKKKINHIRGDIVNADGIKEKTNNVGSIEATEVNDTDEAEEDDDNDSGEADAEDGEEGEDDDAVESGTEFEDNHDGNGDEEEDGEVQEVADGGNSEKSSSLNNNNVPKKDQQKNGSQETTVTSTGDETTNKATAKSKLLKRKIANLGGAANKGETATKLPATKKRILGGALGSGRKAPSGVTGTTPKKKKEPNSTETGPTRMTRQAKKKTVSTNGNVAATASTQANPPKKAKRGGRGSRTTRKKLS